MEFSEEILEKLSKRTVEYISNDLGMIEIDTKFLISEVNQLKLLDISTMIALSGCAIGTIGISVSNKFAYEMVKNFIFGEMSEEDLNELASENVAETLNIVLGNILTDLQSVKSGQTIEISTPYTLHNRVTISKKKNGKMYLSLLSYKEEKILLSYFI